jgi:predicted signal transduction protein with EAL and GGDEF domain
VHAIERIADCLSHPFNMKGWEARVSGSMGISSYPQDGNHLDALI